MPPLTRPVRLNSPLRRNSNADPDDVLAVKRRLADLGFYEPPTGDFHPWPDAELFDGITNFQRAAGETPDGEMLPGGPTEAALNRLSQRSVGRLPSPASFLAENQRGLGERPTPANDDAGDPGARPETESTRTRRFATAMPLLLPAAAATAATGGAALPGLLALAALGVLGYGLHYVLSRQEPVPEGASLMDAEGWHPPASPADPPRSRPMAPGFGNDEDPGRGRDRPPPVEDSTKPDITQLIPPELDPKDWIEVYPADPGLKLPIVLENRGNEATRQLNTKINRCIEDAAKELGVKIVHEGGGRDREGNEVKEKHLKNKETGGLKGGSFLDGAYRILKTGQRIFFNTFTARADGSPISREERQAARILKNKEDGDILILIPKGELDEEACRAFFRDLIQEMAQGTPSDAKKGWRLAPIRS